jgi:hypothetical protein
VNPDRAFPFHRDDQHQTRHVSERLRRHLIDHVAARRSTGTHEARA